MRIVLMVLAIVLGGCLFGCANSAGFELATADLGEKIHENLSSAVDEYHSEVVLYDDTREASHAAAFIARVQRHINDPVQLAKDQAEFLEAGRRVRADREVESDRRANVRETLALVKQMSQKMRTMAMDSMSLDDEFRRYVTGWLDTYQKTRERKVADRAAAAEQRRANINASLLTAQTAVLPMLGIPAPTTPIQLPTKGGN